MTCMTYLLLDLGAALHRAAAIDFWADPLICGQVDKSRAADQARPSSEARRQGMQDTPPYQVARRSPL